MESVQSDSSGFGDAETAGDSDTAKQAGSLGSSLGSDGTLAGSNAATLLDQPKTGEIATQTVEDANQNETMDQQYQGFESKYAGHEMKSESVPADINTMDEHEKQHYVSTCFIPTLGAKTPGADRPHREDPWHGHSKDDNYMPDRANMSAERRQTVPNLLSYVSEIKYKVHDHPSEADFNNKNRLSHSSQSKSHRKRQYMPHEVTPLSRPTTIPLEDDYLYSSPMHHDHWQTRPRQFLSQREFRVASQNMGRLSQDILPARNDIPLSEELANAKGSWKGHSDSEHVSLQSAKSSTATRSTSDVPHAASTPASISGDEQRANSVSSFKIYINPKEKNLPSHSLPFRNNSESGHSHQPIAGNLSGLGNSYRRTTSSVSHCSEREFMRQRSCDILEDEGDIDVDVYPAGFSANNSNLVRDEYSMNYSPHKLSIKRHSSPGETMTSRSDVRAYTRHSIPFSGASNAMEDLEGLSQGESGSEFSVQSYPEGALKSGALDAQKLARLINKPVFSKGKQRQTAQYRPRRNFKEWHLLNKKKRLHEENRLLQHSIQKYKDELYAMEMSFMYEYQAVYDDLTDEERDEADELEWLWEEVKIQVSEMERLLMTRIKSVHSGNDFHSLLSNLGVINKTIELLKEQMYQRQTRKQEHAEDDYPDQFYVCPSMSCSHEERPTFLPSHSFMDDMARGVHYPQRSSPRHVHSASMSSLPASLNASLDQIKASLLKEMKEELKSSTQKLEVDLLEKDREIQVLKHQLESEKSLKKSQVSPSEAKPPTVPNRKSMELKRDDKRGSRSRIVGDRVVTETDV